MPGSGRIRQKERTRAAIVTAAVELVERGAEFTMPSVATAARVSEATAYRYFPDLPSLLGATLSEVDTRLTVDLTGVDDPVERVGRTTEDLARRVLARHGAVRALVATALARPELSTLRPGHRFTLIATALEPWSATAPAAAVERLTHELALVVGAEAVFTLLDVCGLTPEQTVRSLGRTARTLTAAAVRPDRATAGRRRGPGAAAGRGERSG